MARYTGPVCRLCRREQTKLFLKGERCFTPKCAIDRRNYPPGQHGPGRQKKVSQYGIQLREKQKLRRIYGVSERQFRSYFARAAKQAGVTGEAFLRFLERRLDNVVYRLGFAYSRSAARQLVAHGNIRVNGRKVDVPSYLVRPGEQVSLNEKHRQNPVIQQAVQSASVRAMPVWLELNPEVVEGKITALPNRGDIDTQINEQLIVEFYSR
ncbi:30S ribosomal protein S4 [bacterium CPR1]|nr:30S ribosomal protein S4 [bacterium CPR1]